MAREKWTDERLDDLNLRVEKGFDEVKGEIRDLRAEMNGRFDSVNGRFDSFQAEMNSRFDSMQRTMVIGFASIVASVVGVVVAGLALG